MKRRLGTGDWGLGAGRAWPALLVVLAFAGCATPGELREDSEFAAIVQLQFRRYPSLEAPDLYKLAYQAAMGPAHLGLDSAMALRWLEEERPRLDSAALVPEALLDTIAPGGRLVRLNLRPFIANGGDLAAVAGALAATQGRFEPSRPRLQRYLRVITRLAADRDIPVTLDTWMAQVAWMERDSFPPGEHSKTYMALYRPAYRVLDGAAVETVGQ